MQLYRFESGGKTILGIGSADRILSAESVFRHGQLTPPEPVLRADIKAICAAPDSILVRLQEIISEAERTGARDAFESFDPAAVRILPPIPNPGKIICVGLNYRDHCEEQGHEPPVSPVLFAKFANTVCGHREPVRKPPITTKLDFEGELGVVIGTGGKGIPKERALACVFGYTVINDVTARDIQKSDGQWLRAKGQDGFAPMGPCIATTAGIPDPQNLGIRTAVNGKVMQESNTNRMIFGVADIVAFITQGITLEPGDIISTGTPSGVGVWRNPPSFLEAGDVIEIEIEKIGKLVNPVTA